MAVENSRAAVVSWFLKNAGTNPENSSEVKLSRDGMVESGGVDQDAFRYATERAPEDGDKLSEHKANQGYNAINTDRAEKISATEIEAAAERLTDEQIEKLSEMMSKADDATGLAKGPAEPKIRDAQYQFINYLAQTSWEIAEKKDAEKKAKQNRVPTAEEQEKKLVKALFNTFDTKTYTCPEEAAAKDDCPDANSPDGKISFEEFNVPNHNPNYTDSQVRSAFANLANGDRKTQEVDKEIVAEAVHEMSGSQRDEMLKSLSGPGGPSPTGSREAESAASTATRDTMNFIVPTLARYQGPK